MSKMCDAGFVNCRCLAGAIATLIRRRFVLEADVKTPLEIVQQYSSSCPFVPYFTCAAPPAASLEDYIYKLMRYLECPLSCYIGAVCVLFEVTSAMNCLAPLCTYTAHRLYLTSLELANKLLCDEPERMRHFSSFGGVKPYEMQDMELNMLQHINFQVKISTQEYREMRCLVENAALVRS